MPPQAQPVASAAPAALPLGSSAGNQQQLWVGYFKRMKPQRVYRLVVEMQPVNGKKGVTTAPPADPVLARPIIPGALVSRGAVGRFVIRHVPPMPGYPDLTVRFARELQYGYDVARVKARDHLSFYVFAGLLGLTALSWVAHRPARARRVGKPFVPPAPAGSASPSSPLDFGPAVSHR
jgi:hypothetical protein